MRDTSKPLKNGDNKFAPKKAGCEQSSSTSNVLLNELQTAPHPKALASLGAYQEKNQNPTFSKLSIFHRNCSMLLHLAFVLADAGYS